MNNGHRILREDTYTEVRYEKIDGYEYSYDFNLESYTSNMNIMRQNHQAIYCRRAIMGICGDSYWI